MPERRGLSDLEHDVIGPDVVDVEVLLSSGRFRLVAAPERMLLLREAIPMQARALHLAELSLVRKLIQGQVTLHPLR